MKSRAYALDANALIFYITDEPDACKKLIPIIQDPNVRLIIPSVVIAELWAAPEEALGQLEPLRDLLGTAIIVPLDEMLAQSAGVIRRTYRLKLGDACVAATALAHGVPLLTRDSDFKHVSDLLIEPI